MFGDKSSNAITDFIKTQIPEKSETELEEINYGLKVVFANLYKFPIIFLLSYFLGILNYAFYAFLFYGLIRTLAAGLHMRNSLVCLLFTSIIFLTIVYCSKLLFIDYYLRIIICAFSFVLICLFAPADTEEKPYLSSNKRKLLKILSIILSVIYIILTFLIRDNIVSNIILFSLLIESFLITPLVYKIFGRRWDNHAEYT